MKTYPDPGTRIKVTGLGKHGVGTVMQQSELTAASYRERKLVTYRCDYNMGEHLVPLDKVQLLRKTVIRNGKTIRKKST